MVQGDGEGIHGHENKLIVTLVNNGTSVACQGYNFVYADNADPAYSGILSVLLAAQASARQVEIYVNTTIIVGGNALEIAWVSLTTQ